MTVGGQNCLLSAAAWGQYMVQCISPALQGALVPVVLKVGIIQVDSQLSSPAYINYSAPIIAGISPSSRYIGDQITITSAGTQGKQAWQGSLYVCAHSRIPLVWCVCFLAVAPTLAKARPRL